MPTSDMSFLFCIFYPKSCISPLNIPNRIHYSFWFWIPDSGFCFLDYGFYNFSAAL